MTFIELAKKRHSCRKYLETKVEKEKLNQILEAARIAPTGANKQAQKLIVVQEAEGLKKLAKAAGIYGAPLAIIVCSDASKVWTRPYDGKKLTDIDATIITDHMMLAATDLGLNTVWICLFEPEILKKEFSLPDNLEAINILVVGYGADEVKSPDRHDTARNPIENLVSYEHV